MSLTHEQKQRINQLSEQYKAAALQRTQDDPATFEANLNYIMALAEVTAGMKRLMKGQSDRKMLEMGLAIKDKVFSPAMTAILKEEFEKEPRIISAGAHYRESYQETRMFRRENKQMTYNIEFKDGSKLEWHSMDQDKLAEIKEKFNERMQELSRVKRHRIGG